MQAPPPRRGGRRLSCPIVDVAATEATGELHMRDWHRGRDTAKARAAFRRHFRRDHWEPFAAETHALMRYITTGEWGGMTGVRAEVTLSK